MKNPTLNNPFFIAAILNLEVYQRLLPYLELHEEGLTKLEIQEYIQLIAEPEGIIPRESPDRELFSLLSDFYLTPSDNKEKGESDSLINSELTDELLLI